MAPVPTMGFATTTGSGAVGARGAPGMAAGASTGLAAGRRRPNSRARGRSRGPTVQEQQCAWPGGIACGRAWSHGDRAASIAIAPESDKWNSVTIHAKFTRTSREIRESACLTESEAFANVQHSVAKLARTSREYGVEDNAYLTFTPAGRCPRPFLGLVCPLPLRHSVEQLPGGGRARGGQCSPKCPSHLHVPVRRIPLHDLHLVRPIPHQDFPRVHDDGGDVVGGAAQEHGVVCAHGGVWLHLGGAEDVLHHVPGG